MKRARIVGVRVARLVRTGPRCFRASATCSAHCTAMAAVPAVPHRADDAPAGDQSFAVVGAYLSNQIANNLFQERLAQAESETRYNVKQVQDTFDGAQVTDQSSVITLVYDTLNAVEGRGSVIQRRYVFEAMPEQTKPRNRWVESRASDQLTISVIPTDLRKAVQDSGKDQFWASTEFPVGTEDRPGIAVGNKVTFNGTVYELYLIYDLNTAQKTLDEIQNVLLAGGAVLALLIGAVAWYVTRNVVSPVSHAAVVSEKLAAGQLQERMVVKGEDEVARLGASFNHMAASLQEQITAARHPVPDAAALRLRRLPRAAHPAHHRADGRRSPLRRTRGLRPHQQALRGTALQPGGAVPVPAGRPAGDLPLRRRRRHARRRTRRHRAARGACDGRRRPGGRRVRLRSHPQRARRTASSWTWTTAGSTGSCATSS